MSPKRSTRRLLRCAALSAGVLLGSGAASAEAPRPEPAPARASFSALLDAALRIASAVGSPAAAETAPANFVELQPQRRMGNTKGPGYTDQAACDTVQRAQPVGGQARTARRTPR
jgi:hypothetical protein